MPSEAPSSGLTELIGHREITRLLAHWREGDHEALNRVVALVYRDLHLLAKQYLHPSAAGGTFQPTALVHEVYRYLMGQQALVFQDRQHFLKPRY